VLLPLTVLPGVMECLGSKAPRKFVITFIPPEGCIIILS